MCKKYLRGGGTQSLTNQFKACKKVNKCYNSDMKHHYYKKQGFTLAEVLITLGIIGVVAALTLPTIITKYQHKALETAFKKSYSNLMQAMVYAEPELISNMSGNYAGDRDSEFYSKLWEKYNIVKDFNDKSVFGISNLYSKLGGVKTYDKKSDPNTECPQLPHLMGADGMSVGGMYNCYANWVVLDINGPYKKPNALGHDIFYFGVDTTKKQIFPLGINKVHSYWNFGTQARYCSKNSTDQMNGYGCTAFALENKCPDDPSKTYWECLP